jgi:gamma-butyrobetaine dioxygenase
MYVLPVVNPIFLLQSVSQKQHCLDLIWSDGSQSRFNFLWLRDNCPTTLHPDTQERVFDQLSISANIHPLKVSIENDQLLIDWSEQHHHSEFPGSWLRNHAYSGDLKPGNRPASRSWDNSFLDQINSVNYIDLMQDNEALYAWMKQLDQDGLSLVQNMPSTKTALNEVTNRIDYQRQTNFGITFEVKTEPKPTNLAYTALALPLHTDLPNQETPPGYQFLHCLANESAGGESLFADGLRILEELRLEDNEHFELLANHAIPFRFHDDEHDIYHHHPVINLDHQGNIIELKYNAHLASIFDLPEDIMHDYYLAYRELMARVRSPKYRITLKLTEGTMAVFDNRRVLHGREAFEPTGNRHLRGCYIDRSEFQSRLRVLKKRLDKA